MPSIEILNQVIPQASDSFRDSLKKDLRFREGEGRGIEGDPRIKDENGRFLAYFDSEGIPTIGIGSRTSAVFDENGVRRSASPEEVEADFDINVDEAIAGTRRIVPSFDSLSSNRKMALANMVFQMGASGVAGFKDMLKAIAKNDFESASREILDSRFARQMAKTGNPRAKDMAKLMIVG